MFADKDSEVTLYSYGKEHYEYNGEFNYYWVKGTGLAANSTLKKPPTYEEGFIPIFKDGEWVVVENHFGKTSYNTETKEPKIVDYVGEIQQGWTFLEPIEFGEWDGNSWVDNRTEEEIAEYNRSLMPTLSPIEFDIKLVDAGLYDQVQSLIQSDIKLRIAYTRATLFSRTDLFVDQARIALGLTNEQVDAIWTQP